MAHLVYQPDSLIQSCFVRRWHRQWCWHRHHLCTRPPTAGLDIETSYLVYTCTCAPYKIFSDSDLWFLAHLVYQPKSLLQSCFVRCWHCPALVSSVLSLHTSPWYMARHRNFILGAHMSPIYAHQIFNDSDL